MELSYAIEWLRRTERQKTDAIIDIWIGTRWTWTEVKIESQKRDKEATQLVCDAAEKWYDLKIQGKLPE